MLGEGFAASRLEVASTQADGRSRRRVLATIATDERRHAALAADIVEWAARVDPVAARRGIAAARRRVPAAIDEPDDLRRFPAERRRAAGFVDEAQMVACWRATTHDVLSRLPHTKQRRRSAGSALVVIAVLVLGAACANQGEVSSPSNGNSPASPPPGVNMPAASPGTTTPPGVRASAGCGTPPPVKATDDPVGDVLLEIDSGGETRTYRFGVPPSYDPDTPTPLILDLHGASSNAAQQSVYSRLPAEGTHRGYLVITPDAKNAKWELAGQGPDAEFLMTLMDRVDADYCVDLDRVFAAGISLGSWKATITACTHPDRFAALALVAEEVAPPKCAMPVVAFHGTADRSVPYGTGADAGVVVTGANAGLTGVEVNMPAWSTQAGCSDQKDIVKIDPDVEHWTFQGCPDGVDVEFYRIDGGGHTWSGSPIDMAALGHRTTTISATTIALDFFDAHPKRRG